MGRGFESSRVYQIIESWPSGLKQQVANLSVLRGTRGFESHTLCQHALEGSLTDLSRAQEQMVGRKVGVLIGLENRDGLTAVRVRSPRLLPDSRSLSLVSRRASKTFQVGAQPTRSAKQAPS